MSLRQHLLWWLLLPLAVFTAISGMMSYDAARQTADLVQDGALLASARTIGEVVGWDNGVVTATIPPAALEIFESPEQDHVFYRVIADGDRLLAGTPDLALPSVRSAQPVYFETTLNGQSIHAIAYERQLYDAGNTTHITVVVGKTQASRTAMIQALWHPQLLRQLIMLVLAALLVWLGLTFELRPLMKLKDDVANREPMQLVPIHADRLHAELRPIVDAINQCIARLHLHAAAQRQFIADAAHQLRTPLTVLDSQIQVARRCANPDPKLAETLRCMQRSSRRMADLTAKLLLLAQAESASSDSYRDKVDVANVMSDMLSELLVIAQQRNIDLGADLCADSYVAGNASLLSALMTNLVDNALRYTQCGGHVTASCRREGDEVLMQVADNGPGIAAEARSRVFQRFYRGTTNAEGTGLGMAIVREIAHSHGGTVQLDPGAGGIGLVATVRMRAWQGDTI
ncbi:histidine kinase [Pandoraea terrae]|uniref:histidine kinase n=1 Tax=Pandoraea terrae TaxID=1537710 RepID=A0A5E4SQJ7_9BURK|nr:sensor histidine kinase [Pandoraea terrae]VVD77381.1 histidine kinase [Pandoraea terrae]